MSVTGLKSVSRNKEASTGGGYFAQQGDIFGQQGKPFCPIRTLFDRKFIVIHNKQGTGH